MNDAPQQHKAHIVNARIKPTPPWDFLISFPPPTESAILEAVLTREIDGDGPTPDEIAGIHIEHANEMVSNLDDIKYLQACRLNKLNPATGKPLSARSKPIEYAKLIREHWRNHRSLLDVYENAFGYVARRAFDRHCVAASEDVLIIETGQDELLLAKKIEDISDLAERERRTIEWFNSQCPAVWIAGVRIWNADRVGPFKLARGQPDYSPNNPFYHHMSGKPVAAAQIVENAKLLANEQLDDLTGGRKHGQVGVDVLTQHKKTLDDLCRHYNDLYDHGPIRLPDRSKTSQRFGKSPITVWAETMTLLCNQIAREASIVKGLKHRSSVFTAITKPGVTGSQLELF